MKYRYFIDKDGDIWKWDKKLKKSNVRDDEGWGDDFENDYPFEEAMRTWKLVEVSEDDAFLEMV